jgi:hypothetical protein
MTDKKYPFTIQELSDLINKLPEVFPGGLVRIPPQDCNVEWSSFYSGEEIFKEIPERDVFTDESGDTIVDEVYPKRHQNIKVGEGISIRSKSDVDFRIFDPQKLLIPIFKRDSTNFLQLIVALIREFANRQIEHHKDDIRDMEAAQKPWIGLRDEAISWQSIHDCVDMDIFEELCSNSEQAETTQTDECWVDTTTWELMFQGKQYVLGYRQYQIIRILKFQPDPENGMERKQLMIKFKDSYPKPHLTVHFRIGRTFVGEKGELLGTLISKHGPKPIKYSLSVDLANRE